MTKKKNLETVDCAASSREKARGPRTALVVYAVLGALALGVWPAQGEWLVLAQTQTADAGVKAGVKRPGKINMGPLRAFITRSKQLKEQGKLDLSKPHAITIAGDRAEDGTLSNVTITGESSKDANMRRTAEDFVASLNESHALQFLEGAQRVAMTFTLDAERFRAETAADVPTETRAEEMARGYRVMLNLGRMMNRGKAEAAVLSGMKISSNGKQLLMTLDTTREAMGNLLLKQVTPN